MLFRSAAAMRTRRETKVAAFICDPPFGRVGALDAMTATLEEALADLKRRLGMYYAAFLAPHERAETLCIVVRTRADVVAAEFIDS